VVISVTGNGTYVLTNHHVVAAAIKQLSRWDPLEGKNTTTESTLPVNVETFAYDERGRHIQTMSTVAEIVAYARFGDKWDFDGDLALLRLKAPVTGMLAARVISEEDFYDDVRVLNDVIMIGCPKGAYLPLPLKGHIASISEEMSGVGLLLSQLLGNPGNSGSAVYRYSPHRGIYEIVAVHSMRDSARGALTDQGDGSFLRFGVQAPAIHKFLETTNFSTILRPNALTESNEQQNDGS